MALHSTNAPTAHILRVNAWGEIPGAIAVMQAAGAHHRIPLLQALYAGRIAHFEAQRDTSSGTIKMFFSMARLPAVVLLGDDDHASTGPAGWPIAPRLMRWARLVVIHGTGGQPAHYEAAVESAEAVGRVVFIETSAPMVPAWCCAIRAAPHRPAMVLYLPTDDAHPVLPALEAVQ